MVSPLGFDIPGHTTEEYAVFLSSADQFLNERTIFKELVDEVNQAMILNQHTVRLLLKEWETLPGFRTRKTVNSVIIDTTLVGAHLVVALLGYEIKPGTKEELDYAIDNNMQMCVIVLSDHLSDETEAYLSRFKLEENILVLENKRLQKSPSALLLRSVLSRTLNALQRQQKVHYVEER